uniref:Uncharacterized protein n=1 Tax=Chromera velia CCMP2878 TaxID=1169474 RepID=A0A0G4HWG7_9ALVE|eukprot:Cvel_9035.t1-p1 / transcript=Cvel_9035.t1 / gene=Cvel_9035 / organism=Chromera_velia_CCMP2878 / gene_product=Phosphatidylinositol 3,4,5-trisphosphate, putative / transcript_product=Phosphatidylinositol 3,4,5-trisphosphate, putative / location=Cvel_scaffold512:26775-32956(+) / protein_length=916 / sequence_SO=supercontig / SO=protein_coding / is_pseudo=false
MQTGGAPSTQPSLDPHIRFCLSHADTLRYHPVAGFLGELSEEAKQANERTEFFASEEEDDDEDEDEEGSHEPENQARRFTAKHKSTGGLTEGEKSDHEGANSKCCGPGKRKSRAAEPPSPSAARDREAADSDEDSEGGHAGKGDKKKPPKGKHVAADPSFHTRVSVFGAVRGLVSKKKRRLIFQDYNLDLAYVTSRVIAMGFPSAGMQALFRNPRSEVKRYLDTYHKDHYKLYNLCAEASMKYPASDFYGRVAEFGFFDHCPPPLRLLLEICRDLMEWLQADPQNVAVIHCKAGKGRTGVAVCALLLAVGATSCPAEAFSVYGTARALDGKVGGWMARGVTIPSQFRFIRHFSYLIDSFPGGAEKLVAVGEPDLLPIEIWPSVLSQPFDTTVTSRRDKKILPLLLRLGPFGTNAKHKAVWEKLTPTVVFQERTLPDKEGRKWKGTEGRSLTIKRFSTESGHHFIDLTCSVIRPMTQDFLLKVKDESRHFVAAAWVCLPFLKKVTTQQTKAPHAAVAVLPAAPPPLTPADPVSGPSGKEEVGELMLDVELLPASKTMGLESFLRNVSDIEREAREDGREVDLDIEGDCLTASLEKTGVISGGAGKREQEKQKDKKKDDQSGRGGMQRTEEKKKTEDEAELEHFAAFLKPAAPKTRSSSKDKDKQKQKQQHSQRSPSPQPIAALPSTAALPPPTPSMQASFDDGSPNEVWKQWECTDTSTPQDALEVALGVSSKHTPATRAAAAAAWDPVGAPGADAASCDVESRMDEDGKSLLSRAGTGGAGGGTGPAGETEKAVDPVSEREKWRRGKASSRGASRAGDRGGHSRGASGATLGGGACALAAADELEREKSVKEWEQEDHLKKEDNVNMGVPEGAEFTFLFEKRDLDKLVKDAKKHKIVGPQFCIRAYFSSCSKTESK